MNDDDDPFVMNEDEYFGFFKSAPVATPREMLERGGFVPLQPAEVPAGAVSGRLSELLYALAARRFFFWRAEHLSDAELYSHVLAWLDRPQRDISWKQGWNCLHDCSDSGGGEDVWSNPWFDEESHAQWRREFPNIALPKDEPPPEPGTRLLPEPPHPPFVDENATGGIPTDWLADGDEDDGDPLGLAGVDREIASASAAAESEKIEKAEVIREDWHRPVDQMQRTGFTPVPPDEITGEALAPLLWELLHQLACRGFYTMHTDHLTDMELYRELWRKAIREDSLMPGRRSRTGYWMHDILGSYGDEEIQLELACYASDAERERHVREFPSIPLPEKIERVALRDWRLPKPPF